MGRDIEELWNNFKKCNIHNQNTKKKMEQKQIIEVIMVEIFQRLMTDNKTHIQESQKGSSKINFEKPTIRISCLNCRKLKSKRKYLKESRGKICFKEEQEYILSE